MLHYSAGVHKKENNYRYIRTYGSGGGLYPISLYLYIKNVSRINPGIYLYQPVSHSLKYISDKNNLSDILEIDGDFNRIRNIQDLSAVFIYVYDSSSNYLKYGEFSLLLALMDIGAIIQTMHLIATYQKDHFSAWGGFKKRSIEQQLNIDGIKTHVLMTAVIGVKNEI